MHDGSQPLSAVYLDADRRQRVLHSKIGCVLALVLMPAGASLDLFVYPEFLWEFIGARLLCDVGVASVLLLLYTRFGERHIRVLGILWALLPGAAISWMIWFSEGVVSPYYAGLNLVIIAVSLLMPWTLSEVLITCSITLLFYLAAVTGHSLYLDTSLLHDRGRDLFNNIYFISLTAVICGTAAFFLSRLRFGDWRLRYELRQSNDDLNESYKKLSELDRLKSEFFANVSHELRTPLTLILAPLDELRRRGGTGDARTDEFLAVARENGLRLLRLINDMLDLVRLDAKGAELQLHAADLARVVPGIIQSAGHLARTKGLELAVHAPDTPLPARIDINALEKVLLNLFTNAVKFTPAGGRIDVKLARQGSRAVIEVQDSGIGIAPQDLPRIFDRFGQLDSSPTRQYSGVGIGLALSRELVEAQGGVLTATSELGKGTVLRVELPTAESAASTRAQATPDALSELHSQARRALTVAGNGGQAPQEAVGQGEPILVVEDEPDMRRFIVSLLAEQYRVYQAADGIAGQRMALQVKPKLALLDVMLPGMDGLELCRSLRRESTLEGLKVVMLTARSDEESKITALQGGANDFLVKPFSTVELRTRIANLLKSAELEERVRRTNDELRSTLRTLRETEEQLIASEKLNALGTMAAGLLHEINNPLNFTMAATQLALMNTEDPEVKEALSDVDSGMKRIKNIVTDLKTFAYPEKQARKEVFHLAHAVESAMKIAAHSAPGLRPEVQIAPELRVRASENQTVQVLINLLTNAAKATEPRGENARVNVSARQEGLRVHVTVKDNGVGIDADILTRVFDPFFTTREPGEGMGLGLSICQTIVRNHGGRIGVDSAPGQGTEVTFDLPSASEELG
jgi:signal transduction histidine kinase